MIFYITHYTPLTDRKQNIINQLIKYNITNYEFIEIYDKEKLNLSDIQKFTDLKLSEISLFLKHVEIYKKNINNNNIIIVLEDDAIFVDNFLEKLKYYLNNLPKIWDVIFPGECCELNIKEESNKIFYKTPISRGTCMYILNINTSNKIINIINNLKIINKPIDHFFDYLHKYYNFEYYWTEPILVLQGSELGIFKSSIR
jgi:GR25 family glycosyltransferase involved in LPS biosynthesis